MDFAVYAIVAVVVVVLALFVDSSFSYRFQFTHYRTIVCFGKAFKSSTKLFDLYRKTHTRGLSGMIVVYGDNLCLQYMVTANFHTKCLTSIQKYIKNSAFLFCPLVCHATSRCFSPFFQLFDQIQSDK